LPTSSTTRPLPGPNGVVEGTVTSAWGVPLVPFKVYKVDDGTGEMTVVANNGRTPVKGSRVKVKGRVSDLAAFGGQSVGLHLEQKDVDSKSADRKLSQQEGQEIRTALLLGLEGVSICVIRTTTAVMSSFGGVFAAPLGDRCEDRLHDRPGREARGTAHDLEEPLGGELVAGFVHRLEHAVRAEHEDVALLQRKRHSSYIDP
jgi:hypothetical protein